MTQADYSFSSFPENDSQTSSTSTHPNTLLTSSSSTSHILSEKVFQALQIRTDIPTMQAALDALSSLSMHSSASPSMATISPTTTGTVPTTMNTTNRILDAKSIRTAIELDTLHQSQIFQQHLQVLVGKIHEMKQGLQDIAKMTQNVQMSLNSTIFSTSTSSTQDQPLGETHRKSMSFQNKSDSSLDRVRSENDEVKDPHDQNSSEYPSLSRNDHSFHEQLEKEQKLAHVIADAFARRAEAKKYHLDLVDFFKHFDLSFEETQLLDSFQFTLQDFMVTASPGVTDKIRTDGIAFLDILDRIHQIRVQLSKSFIENSFHTIDDNDSETNMDDVQEKGMEFALAGGRGLAPKQKLDTSSAVRMMKQLSSRQDKAYQHLYESLHLVLDTSTKEFTTVKDMPNTMLVDLDFIKEEVISHPFFQRSLQILQRDAHTYYSHIVELLANQRRAMVTRRFLFALTTGVTKTAGATRNIRQEQALLAPLERMAHDPVTYVGDMLAFVFQCLNDESDLVRLLMTSKLLSADVTSSRSQDDDSTNNKNLDQQFDESIKVTGFPVARDLSAHDGLVTNTSEQTMSVTEFLNHTVGGVVRPLRSRISTVISSLTRRSDDGDDGDDDDFSGTGQVHDAVSLLEENAVAKTRLTSLYSISGLLVFYYSVMDKAVQKLKEFETGHSSRGLISSHITGNALIQCVLDSLNEAADAFSASLRVYALTLNYQEDPYMIASQLKPPVSLAHELVVQLCQCHEASPGFAPDFQDFISSSLISEEAKIAISMSNITDIVMEQALKSCENLDDACTLTLMINRLKESGVTMECIRKWEEIILDKEQTLIDSMISADVSLVLDRMGLSSIIKATESAISLHVEGSQNPSLQVEITQQSIQSALQKFFASLREPPIPNYETKIRDLRIRRCAQAKVIDSVVAIYASLFYSYPDLCIPAYSPEQVKALLQP